MLFDWDQANVAHLARHRITTQEAEEVLLNDPMENDAIMVDGEERVPYTGETNTGRILVVIATFRNLAVRVVTGWDASTAEKREYLRRGTELWHPES